MDRLGEDSMRNEAGSYDREGLCKALCRKELLRAGHALVRDEFIACVRGESSMLAEPIQVVDALSRLLPLGPRPGRRDHGEQGSSSASHTGAAH